ncbi:MAG: peptidyl-prolyl cis-trans isomerase [Rhodoferax sp.]|nr:peptidyl-prolyl cis-trans isomerase [Rhodoferax sp.]
MDKLSSAPMRAAQVFATGLALCAALTCRAQAQDLLRVNGHPITLEQAEAANPLAADQAQVRQQVAEQLAQQQLLADTVKQVPPEVRARIEAGQQNLRRQALAQLAANDFLQAHPISHEAIQQAYDKLIADLPARQHWLRWIVVKTPEQAKSVLDALRSGKQTFTALALTHSIGQNAELGGALGWQSEQAMSAAVLGVVRKLQPGQVAGPIVLGSDYAIVQLLAVRPTEKPSLEQLKPQIEQKLRQAALEAHVQSLAKNAKIDNLMQTTPAAPAPNKEQKHAQ